MQLKSVFLAFMGGVTAWEGKTQADMPSLPGDGFAASRYEALWTKSPFAVAPAEMAQESPDYSLVGIAQFDGVSYVSLIDKQNQQHFLLTTDNSVRGLTLISITRGHEAGSTFATLQKNGQLLTLKLDLVSALPAMALSPVAPPPGAGQLPAGFPMITVKRSGANGNVTNVRQLPPQATLNAQVIHGSPSPSAPQ